MDFKIEVVVVPVSDVDRAKDMRIGFREDVDFAGPGGFRGVHLTPPGSAASLIIGGGVTDAAPGSERGMHLIVDDVMAARAESAAAGVAVSEVFHDAPSRRRGRAGRRPAPARLSYGSFASFADPDGSTFVLQEITTRRPGRIGRVVHRSADELESALRDAAFRQMCAPLLSHLDRLSAAQRAAPATALGLSGGESPGYLLTGLAVSGLFAEAAVVEPLVCVVDDAQALLDSVLPGPVHPHVRDVIVAEARGDPLVLLELPHGESDIRKG